MEVHTALFFYFFLLSMLVLSTATDTLTMSQSIRHNGTIVSAGKSFELGFFSPSNSTKQYLGIWYKKIPTFTVVWVANREMPLFNSSGVLKVTNPGILVLLDGNETTIWSSNSSRSVRNPVAQLLDSGNLVVRDASDDNPENFLWQSFDYPGDTLLAGMKLGRNVITGLDRYLSSWKSTGDPSKGIFTYSLDPRGYPQFIMREGSEDRYRDGHWNFYFKQNPFYTFGYVFNQKEMYYIYELVNSSVVTRVVLNPEGVIQRFIWNGRTEGWKVFTTAQRDNCDTYALCGAHGTCNIENSPACGCLKGFVPKYPKEWDIADWSSGCVRRMPLDCPGGDGFIKYSGVKLPDTRYSWFNVSMSLKECKMVCSKNCSCMAYATLDISTKGGSGCLLWFGNLIDIRNLAENGQEIYIRMASSEIDRVGSDGKKRAKIIVSLVLIAGVLFLGLMVYLWKKKNLSCTEKNADSQKEDLELPLFDLATIASATNNFSMNNKLGEGGFGPVFKGVLEGGQEIAVKKLSKKSKQGLDEFKNEVSCIAKLQHRNLVKLLGYCIQEETMLIYEYMINKSLDFFIFDQARSKLLDWHKRYHIINGIARGLLYLHQDSRLRIIHRDLKASNILLDFDMNPKISDFGLARRFGGNETEANTTRVVGTYGYMSPEYQVDGLFSVKSDVFSFGVMVLEIVSGKRNRGYYGPEDNLNLLGHAWRLFGEGRSLELSAAAIGNSYNLSEVSRSIHVGLLCVQRRPNDRPTMSSVVQMLSSESALPQPKQPGFFTKRDMFEGDSSSCQYKPYSGNEVTLTLLSPR